MSNVPRLSGKEEAILALLISSGEEYGLSLVQKSDGRLKRGTVYVTLDRMEDKGYVESWTEEAREGEQGPPRRMYRATGFGSRVFQAWQLLRQAKGLSPVFDLARGSKLLGGAT